VTAPRQEGDPVVTGLSLLVVVLAFLVGAGVGGAFVSRRRSPATGLSAMPEAPPGQADPPGKPRSPIEPIESTGPPTAFASTGVSAGQPADTPVEVVHMSGLLEPSVPPAELERETLVDACAWVYEAVSSPAIQQRLRSSLRQVGVELLAPESGPVDPSRHRRVGTERARDTWQSGQVARTVKLGLLDHDRVLRPADVIVYTNAPKASREAGTDR
jgi:hypothetical protein